MNRRSYVDGGEAAERFDVGQKVKVLNERTGNPSRWEGEVVSVDSTAGFVGIEVPFADTLRYRAEIVVPADKTADSRSSGEDAVSGAASKYASRVASRLDELAREALSVNEDGLSAYRDLVDRYGNAFSHAEIRNAVRSASSDESRKDLSDRVAKQVSDLALEDPSVEGPAASLLRELD